MMMDAPLSLSISAAPGSATTTPAPLRESDYTPLSPSASRTRNASTPPPPFRRSSSHQSVQLSGLRPHEHPSPLAYSALVPVASPALSSPGSLAVPPTPQGFEAQAPPAEASPMVPLAGVSWRGVKPVRSAAVLSQRTSTAATSLSTIVDHPPTPAGVRPALWPSMRGIDSHLRASTSATSIRSVSTPGTPSRLSPSRAKKPMPRRMSPPPGAASSQGNAEWRHDLEEAGLIVDSLPLHRGRHGATILAARMSDGTRVAVKRAGLMERALLKQLCGNPHVIELLADGGLCVAGPGRTHYWLATKLYSVGDTARFLRRDSANPHRTEACARKFGADVAGALAAIHAMSISHLDVKPENVFVDGDTGSDPRRLREDATPTFRLGDFGLCWHTDDISEPLDGDGRYLCRSFLIDKSPCLRQPADVYALACSVLEVCMLCHRGRSFDMPRQYDQRRRLLEEAHSCVADKEIVSMLCGGMADEPRTRPSAAEVAAQMRCV
eukprot:TRINITY_DN4956_c1_g1_i8.p1 TRINITY_DN4956_c1_g1~~TRINITY_DN4956_c1_g1_i8.p1  ORF type:complete len:495 (+),score=44.06 TRINITY_DN4956_c1_g1_i8:145-1629(+)